MATNAQETSVARRVSGGKFLTLFLAKEEYGIEILKVQEIIGYMAITPVPRTPDYLRGVINLRGKIIPVVDLRLKLGLPPLEGQTCIIVVRARGLEVGITVDQVSEVANIADKDIEPVPAFGNGVATEDLLGIGKTGGRVRLLLDIDRILSAQDLTDLHAATTA
ncbi:MAG: chemotaxis protein CheW [Elusimicrobia bacterium]|nr:chemotaxis protein CheW [Elusimicrobiota bacterium]